MKSASSKSDSQRGERDEPRSNAALGGAIEHHGDMNMSQGLDDTLGDGGHEEMGQFQAYVAQQGTGSFQGVSNTSTSSSTSSSTILLNTLVDLISRQQSHR